MKPLVAGSTKQSPFSFVLSHRLLQVLGDCFHEEIQTNLLWDHTLKDDLLRANTLRDNLAWLNSLPLCASIV